MKVPVCRRKLWGVFFLGVVLLTGSGQVHALWRPVGVHLKQAYRDHPVIRPSVQYGAGLLIASQNHVWQLVDNLWESVVHTKKSEPIVAFVALDQQSFLIASAQRLTKQHLQSTTVLFESSGASRILSLWSDSQGQVIWLSLTDGVYRSLNAGNSWTKVYHGSRRLLVSQVLVDAPRVFLLTAKGILYSADNGETWTLMDQFSSVAGIDEDFFSENESGIDEESVGEEGLLDEQSSLLTMHWDAGAKRLWYLAPEGVRSLQYLEQKWQVSTLPKQGLPAFESIVGLYVSDRVWVISREGVFGLPPEGLFWKKHVDGLEEVGVLAIWGVDNQTFISTGDKVYRWQSSVGGESWNYWEKQPQFENEPSVQDVQKKAVWYAEVNKEKIDQMRLSAKRQALLPDVSFSFARDRTHHFNTYSNGLVIDRPVEHDRQWSVDVSWDLGEFVYSSAETSIDSRSKLMVQLREDVLDEVTRVYYERRREQLDLLMKNNLTYEQKVFKKLRIDELTALLDAYSGGWFSQRLQEV